MRGALARFFYAAGLAAIVLASMPPAFAVQPDEVLADTALEARARGLSRELRCMVCQNQSIDDSDAPLARDLRILVRERLKAGDTDQAVLDFLVARYGQFVLLRPKFERETAILWLTPLLVFVAGLGLAVMAWRRRSGRGNGALVSPAPLSATEKEKLAEIAGASDRNG